MNSVTVSETLPRTSHRSADDRHAHILSLIFISLLFRQLLLRSVVMSTSVCVSVCLSLCLSVREDISGTTRAIFTNLPVHVAYGRGSVLLC